MYACEAFSRGRRRSGGIKVWSNPPIMNRVSDLNIIHWTLNPTRVCCMLSRRHTNVQSKRFLCFCFLYYPPSSGIASCVRTTGTVMWCLHLTRPCYVALGLVLIWVMCPNWFEEHLCLSRCDHRSFFLRFFEILFNFLNI